MRLILSEYVNFIFILEFLCFLNSVLLLRLLYFTGLCWHWNVTSVAMTNWLFPVPPLATFSSFQKVCLKKIIYFHFRLFFCKYYQ